MKTVNRFAWDVRGYFPLTTSTIPKIHSSIPKIINSITNLYNSFNNKINIKNGYILASLEITFNYFNVCTYILIYECIMSWYVIP